MAWVRGILIAIVIVASGCKANKCACTSKATMPSTSGSLPNQSMDRVASNASATSIDDCRVQQTAALVPEQLPISPDEAQATLQDVSLISTISIALEQNPDLVAVRQTERVGVATLGVADTYPFNPFVQVQATPLQHIPGGGDSGRTAHYVLLMQRIQLAHQQRYREDAALSSLNGIRWSIHQLELQTASTTAQLYFTLLYRRGLRDIAAASQVNNQLLLDSTTKRFDGGDASAADVATVKYDTRATLQQLQLAEANYQSAERDLLRQIGLPPASGMHFSGDLTKISWKLPSGEPGQTNVAGAPLKCVDLATNEGLDPRAWAATRPDVLSARANVAVARANHNLATANRVPDVNVGPYYQQNHDGMTLFGFRADTNLPIIDTGRPMQLQRSAELVQQSVTWQQVQLRAELEAQAAFDRYAVALQSLSSQTSDDDVGLPQELQALERQFRVGEVDVVRAIQARTSILQNQLARLNLLNEIAQAAAALVGATGMPFEMVMTQDL